MRSGVRSRKRGFETAAVMAEIAEELQQVAEGSATPPIRSAALEALFWFQVCSSVHRPGCILSLPHKSSILCCIMCRIVVSCLIVL